MASLPPAPSMALASMQVPPGPRPTNLLVASLGCGVGSGRQGAGPTRSPFVYRLIMRPALAEMVGDGRPWTVLMISLLSMPWR